MTHAGKGPKTYANKEANGLMGKLDLIRNKVFTTTLRDRVMEEGS
jgi:hypothetical protein